MTFLASQNADVPPLWLNCLSREFTVGLWQPGVLLSEYMGVSLWIFVEGHTFQNVPKTAKSTFVH